ncbi:MAG: ATP-dependent RNA helicase HrpA [Pirellulaceae bacterium]|jgi:ATP-dependent helicase HrpA|nr:ATP-dependent RNA helicase HrpA [Pirellulaceae bacterium]
MSAPASSDIETALAAALAVDRARLRRRWQALVAAFARGQSRTAQWEQLRADLAASVQRREERRRRLPKISYDESLPIHGRRGEIAAAIAQHAVVIVCGETGSGKSTQLPKICLELGRGVDGMIGHTQPRRLAARTIAARLAQELGTVLGTDVGFKIRFTDRTRPGTYVKLMTDGMLLAETAADRFLHQYDTIILDEAHERSLNIDFLLGYVTRLLPRRPELRCIITSATIDAPRFRDHFAAVAGHTPIIEVSGRAYPVEVRYRAAEPTAEDAEAEPTDPIVAAVDELRRAQVGDMLVFLPTERDIRETAVALARRFRRAAPPLEILPLYARLPEKEQQRVFAPHTQLRVVLATNVAESALTVPGIRAVVDTGTARISRYAPRSKVQRLPIEPIAQAAADQRMGRCGRIGPGVCIRLYSQEDYLARDRYPVPEIRRTNLAAVILQTLALKLGAIEDFPFLDPPRPDAIREGHQTLFELGAIDGHRHLTAIGRQLARLPVDPRVGRMILAARDRQCLEEVLIVAAFLEIADPRERPPEQAAAADACHGQWVDAQSDFVTILKLWDFYHHLKRSLSRSQLRKACRQNFLSFPRLCEWSDVYRQLRLLVEQQGERIPARRDDVDQLHQALLSGLLSGIAMRGDTHEYTGPGGLKLQVWPGSALFAQRAAWIVAAELVETNRRYARVVARINPRWIEPLAEHLVQRHYDEPQWDAAAGAAMVGERVTLYTLPIVPRRRVPLRRVDPATARQLLIQHGLVEGDLRQLPPFWQHNQQVLQDLEQRAARQRRTDRLVSPQMVFRFYDERLPAQVADRASLIAWLRQHRDHATRLQMCRADLIGAEADTDVSAHYPDARVIGDTPFPLEYRFAPGDDEDGVTITVSRPTLNQLSSGELDWLVPGRVEEKVAALIRTLPKSIRRGLVPVPETARRVAAELSFGVGPFLPTLARALERVAGEPIPVDAFQLDRLSSHLVMKIRVLDEHGQTLAIGAHLPDLRQRCAASGTAAEGGVVDDAWNAPATRCWDFGELPGEVTLQRGGVPVRAFPAVLDRQDGVEVRLLDTLDRARDETHRGLRRLYFLAERKALQTQVAWLPRLREIQLLAAPVLSAAALADQLALLLADRAFLGDDELPRTPADFHARRAAADQRTTRAVQDVTAIAYRLFEALHRARLAWEESAARRWPEAAADVQRQLAALTPPDFLTTVPWTWLQHYPRYGQAIVHRLDKLRQGGHVRDAQARGQLAPWLAAYAQRAAEHRQRGAIDPELVLFRWMLEEFRVSLFAQQLGTALPVSAQRLTRQWARVAP